MRSCSCQVGLGRLPSPRLKTAGASSRYRPFPEGKDHIWWLPILYTMAQLSWRVRGSALVTLASCMGSQTRSCDAVPSSYAPPTPQASCAEAAGLLWGKLEVGLQHDRLRLISRKRRVEKYCLSWEDVPIQQARQPEKFIIPAYATCAVPISPMWLLPPVCVPSTGRREAHQFLK